MSSAGLRGTPVTKGLLLAGVSTSVILQVSISGRRRVPLLVDAFTHVFAFRQSPSELIFGAALLYYCRLFERLQGSAKYGSFVVAACSVAYALEGLLAAAGGPRASSGLSPLIFALLPAAYLDVPPLHKFSFFGWRMTDKVFIYLAAFQLLLSGQRRSLAAGVCGAVAGLLVRMNFAGLGHMRLPAPLLQLIGTTLGRVLVPPGDRQQVLRTAPSGAGAAGGLGGSGLGGAAQHPHQHRGGGGMAAAAVAAPVEPAPEAVEQLMAMGFDPGDVRQALVAAGGNVELALQHLL